MKVAIKDANIFFDLLDMGLLNEFLSLDYHFLTSDFVQNEISSENAKQKLQDLITKKAITIVSLTAFELNQSLKIKRQRKGLSMSDCSVIFLAGKHNAILLSGDGQVRKAAKYYDI